MQGDLSPQAELIQGVQVIQALVTAERERVTAAEQRRVSVEEEQVRLAMSVQNDSSLDMAIRETAAQAASAGRARIERVRQVAATRAQALDQASRDIADLLGTFGSDA